MEHPQEAEDWNAPWMEGAPGDLRWMCSSDIGVSITRIQLLRAFGHLEWMGCLQCTAPHVCRGRHAAREALPCELRLCVRTMEPLATDER